MSEYTQSPSFAFLQLDVVHNVLKHASDPGKLGKYLTDEFRELTGAKIVALIQYIDQAEDFRLVAVNPKRRRDLVYTDDFSALITLARQSENSIIWHSANNKSGSEHEIGVALLVPLRIGEYRVGSIIAYDVPDDTNAEHAIELLEMISTVSALVLRNSFLYEEQEATINSRTRELNQLNELLELKVAQRTAELEDANRDLESFVYSVSHDLRAPVRRVDGFVEILFEDYGDVLDDAGRDYLVRTKNAAEQMGALIEDLLKLSRLSRTPMDLRSVNLSEMAVAVCENLSRTASDRAVDFVIAPDIITTGDPGLLSVVLENLLGNAWKFTSHHPAARIELGRIEYESVPTYYVRDDGAGFDMASASRLFGAFQRMHGPNEFPGTGIGLATVQKIIQRHGGRIWAESEVEQGATFYFTLSGNPPRINDSVQEYGV